VRALAVAIAFLAGCASHRAAMSRRASTAASADASVRALTIADEYVSRLFADDPEEATRADWPGADHGAVRDVSAAARRRWEAYEDDVSARLHAIDPAGLAERARLSRAIVLEDVDTRRQSRVCRSELWDVSAVWRSWQAVAVQAAEVQPVGTPELRGLALARLRGVSRMVDVRIANLREGVSLGYAATRENVASAVGQVDALIATPVRDSAFVRPATRDGDPGFRAEMERVIREELVPALRRYRAFLATEYVLRARQVPGVAALPDGAACYRAAVRRSVTMDVPPERIHEIGLAEIARIRDEMEKIAQRSFGGRSASAVLAQLRTEPEWLYASPEEIVATARSAIDRAWAAAPRWFARLPAARVRVEPYQDFKRASAPADSYGRATAGTGGHGTYWINAFVPPSRSKAGLEATAFHEAVPGHHLQLALAAESGDVPVGRWLWNDAYGEGWGLYAEDLAEEMGLYTSDVDRMGRLSSAGTRAARLVVDSGIHAMGWSRQRAIEYLLENTTLSAVRAASEVDRYAAVPGQAVSYLLGAREIRRLRSEAERALGTRFDIQAFHDVVLGAGILPLSALQERVRAWVASAGGPS
jgi:uncharacterized protein (DUF885 family)